jgi:hypothetical protein
MALTYTWTVTGIKTADVNGYNQAVVQTYWKKIGTDEDGTIGEFNGATPFTLTEDAEGEFIPFAELTEEVVLEWIKAVVVDHYAEHVDSQIQKAIDRTKAVPVTMPWAPAVENVTPTPPTDAGQP